MTNFHSFPGIFRPWSCASHGGSGLIEPSTQNSITEADSVEHSGHLPYPANHSIDEIIPKVVSEPLYAATWRELVHLLETTEQDLLVLSGDVHFSYAMEAHRTRTPRNSATLYQFVSTPLQNLLNSKDRSLIERQAGLTHLRYGGLETRVLPLYTADEKGRVPHDLLFQNTLALVTIETVGASSYTVEQAYLSSMNGEVGVIGRTIIKGESPT